MNKLLWSITHPIQFTKIAIYVFKDTWRKFYE